ARMQSDRIDRTSLRLPCFPLRSKRSAETVNVLRSGCDRRDTPAVDSGFGAGFIRHVPSKTREQAGSWRQAIPALCVCPDEVAPVSEIDGALGLDGFDVRRLTDTIEQQSKTIAEAVRVGTPGQQVYACRQIDSMPQFGGEMAVQKQFMQTERLLKRLE